MCECNGRSNEKGFFLFTNTDESSRHFGTSYPKLCDCKKNPVGRPTLGITKKVSITLTEEQWSEVETYRSKSEFFRLLMDKHINENRRSNRNTYSNWK